MISETPSRPGLIRFASRDQMAARLADLVALSIAPASGPDAEVGIAVSGGATPMPMYETLASKKLPWSRIRLTLVDERLVPLKHPRSNEAAIRKAFAAAKAARIDGLYNGAATPEEGADAAELKLARTRRPFDAVILGMGDDGHTASWFPRAEGLERALGAARMACAVRAKKTAVTGEETDRITLTLAALRDARLIVLMMAGEEKRATFERALGEGPVEDMPVRAILRARPDLWACWAP